jgi:NAD(P)-dependent dehydrogenase (short-subunit alcohol dehydrogenase family)
MGLMDGKRGLVVGIANDHSYAYYIAESLAREGAECLFTHLPGEKMQRRVGKAISQLGIDEPWLESMNAASDEDLDRVFEKIGKDVGKIDFLVHSIAFADRDWLKDGVFAGTPRAAFSQALDISVYTYMAMRHELLRRPEGRARLQRHGRGQGGPGERGTVPGPRPRAGQYSRQHDLRRAVANDVGAGGGGVQRDPGLDGAPGPAAAQRTWQRGG